MHTEAIIGLIYLVSDINLAKSVIVNYLKNILAIQWQSLKWKTNKGHLTKVTEAYFIIAQERLSKNTNGCPDMMVNTPYTKLLCLTSWPQ